MRLDMQLRMAFQVLMLAVYLVCTACAQNVTISTTLIPLPSSSPIPDQPVMPSTIDMPSTTPSTTTCCYVQTLCNNCTEVFNVNSITYCCPNCRGMVLVTDLKCRCTVPKGYEVPDLKCVLSDKVVGNYIALKPSYYDANGSNVLKASMLFYIILSPFIIF